MKYKKTTVLLKQNVNVFSGLLKQDVDIYYGLVTCFHCKDEILVQIAGHNYSECVFDLKCAMCQKQLFYRFNNKKEIVYWNTLPKDSLPRFIGNGSIQKTMKNGINDIDKLSTTEIKDVLWQYFNCSYEQMDELLSLVNLDTIGLLLGLSKEIYIYE